MTWTLKIRGDCTGPIVAEYECPDHGRFEHVVDRDEQGNPPESIACPFDDVNYEPHVEYPCWRRAEWRISAPHGTVRQAEVIRGGVAKAERPEWLDTRPLAEGMSVSEWKARRAKQQEERRWREAKDL